MELTPDEARETLRRGTVAVVGRLRGSSNAALLVEVALDGPGLLAVYKPRCGERPLWDFPRGTLCQREVAAYELSAALGWDIVPATVLREDGPAGPGAYQRFVEHDPEEHYFTLVESHADRFRQFAVFDVLANNTDRKGGHCLRDRGALMTGAQIPGVEIVGIDHGLTFHPSWKLRTVIWDFAGEPLAEPVAEAVRRVATDARDGGLASRLGDLLAPGEQVALVERAEALVRDGRLPHPDAGYHSVPWPLV